MAPSSRLGKLEDLTLTRREDPMATLFLYEQAELLRKAPNLHKMTVSLCGLAPGTSLFMKNIQFLTLYGGKLGPGEIKGLAISCPQVQSFRYTCDGFSGTWANFHTRFSGRELCHALRLWKKTLRVLDVDLFDNQRDAPGDTMDSLKKNSMLEDISLGANCMYVERVSGAPPAPASLLVELLPSSIRTLSVSTVSKNEYPAFVSLADVVLRRNFPRLTRVLYTRTDIDGGSDEIKDVFRRAEVDAIEER